MNRLPRSVLLSALAATLLASSPAFAADPPRVIRLIVPYAVGGGTDILSRHVADELSRELNTTVVVENKPGAGTNIGAAEVVRASNDGTVILMGDLALAVNPTLMGNMPYSPQNDLTPIAHVASAPLVLITNKKSGIESVDALIKQAKDKPDSITFASAGLGNPPHLAGELFKLTTDTDIVHVPYKGVGPALTDILGGHVNMLFTGISSTKALIDEGNLNALAVTGKNRAPTLPNTPTMTELGYGDADVTSWWALYGPAGMNPDTVKLLSEAAERALAKPALKEKLAQQNIEADYSGADQLGGKLKAETQRWAEVIKKAGIEPQ
ncbi:MAG: tripartite tricarboxylate transporter substrate binding protein [Candidimonas sp.]